MIVRMDDASHTAVYNTSELYSLRILRACVDELNTERPASQAILTATNELLDRHGTTGLTCLIAALGRLATTELALRSDRTKKPVTSLLDAWEQHKLTQHTEEDEDGISDGPTAGSTS